MSSSSDEEILLNNSFLELKSRKRCIHPINQNRTQFGEYHQLLKQLKDRPDFYYCGIHHICLIQEFARKQQKLTLSYPLPARL